MDDKKFLFDLTDDEKKKQSLNAAYFYGSEFRDRIFNEPKALPRFAGLARKVLTYYGGEHYNPHTIEFHSEIFIRKMIFEFIEAKVFYGMKKYDWEIIDHFFRKVVGSELKIDIPYDQSVLNKGTSPEHRIAYPHLNSTVN